MYNQQGQTMAVALRPPENDDSESDLGDSSAGSRSMVMYGNSSQGSSSMAEQAMQHEINQAMSQALALQVESLQALQGTPQPPGSEPPGSAGMSIMSIMCHERCLTLFFFHRKNLRMSLVSFNLHRIQLTTTTHASSFYRTRTVRMRCMFQDILS